ncbi:MAG: TRAP transporter large permease, partial [Mangrovicoccus sp.]
PQRVFGVMNNTLLIAVPLFILMGVLLEKSRVAERMLLHVGQLLGGSPRALVVAVLLIATLVAASTGVIGATIVMLALISLPAMRQVGVPTGTAAGLVCAAGTLGQIIPPSIVLILLGDQVSNAYLDAQQRAGNFAPDAVTVGHLFAGALLPGLALVALYGIYVLFSLRKTEAPADHSIQPKGSIKDVIRESLPPILLIIAVLGSILTGVATPTEAAAIGVAGTLLITAARIDGAGPLLRRAMSITAAAGFSLVVMRSTGLARVNLNAAELNLTNGALVAIGLSLVLVLGLILASVMLWRANILQEAFAQTVRVSAMISAIVLAASMLALVFRGFEGDELVHQMLTSLPGDHRTQLLVTLGVIFLMGFILEFVEIVFIVVPIVGPILLQDIDPVWFSVLVAMNLQTSFLTPPFGFALFYFRSVAPNDITTMRLYRAIVPFVLIQLLALTLVFVIPELATWLPNMLFG